MFLSIENIEEKYKIERYTIQKYQKILVEAEQKISEGKSTNIDIETNINLQEVAQERLTIELFELETNVQSLLQELQTVSAKIDTAKSQQALFQERINQNCSNIERIAQENVECKQKEIDLQEKIDPYLRPLYDALQDILGLEAYQKLLARNIIEIAPLAYMRGRTLDNAFIILDEAQNTTPAQMKMFLTRIGFGSKVVITGDSTQKDLPSGTISGLDVAVKVVKDLEGINICTLTSKDVVRHPLVQKIVKAYEDYEKKSSRPRENRRKKG